VANLAFHVAEGDISTLFGQFGPIVEVHLMRDRASGRSKGSGFIKFSRRQDAENAISQINGTMHFGYDKPLRVSFALGHGRGDGSHSAPAAASLPLFYGAPPCASPFYSSPMPAAAPQYQQPMQPRGDELRDKASGGGGDTCSRKGRSVPEEEDKWYYQSQDGSETIQGPFAEEQLRYWDSLGYLPETLPVRKGSEEWITLKRMLGGGGTYDGE